MKYWEIVAGKLRKVGWKAEPKFGAVAAEREDAGRFVVHAHEKLTWFMELEAAIRAATKIVSRNRA